MKRIKMLEPAQGAIDGIHLTDFHIGEEYDVPDDLAADFISLGAAERVYLPDEPTEEAKADPVALDGIDVLYPPENKALGDAPEDKAFEELGELIESEGETNDA